MKVHDINDVVRRSMTGRHRATINSAVEGWGFAVLVEGGGPTVEGYLFIFFSLI